MSATTALGPPQVLTPPARSQPIEENYHTYRWSVQQYHKLIADGILNSDDKVELLEGVLILKMSKNSPHTTAVRKCRRAIERFLAPTPAFFYDSEQPITLPDGEPEPDGMIVRGTIEDFESSHPIPSTIALVIEVADTTLDRDRGIKLRSYARAGIVCYWIVNLIDRQIEVYTQPNATGATPTYLQQVIVSADQKAALSLDENIIAEITAADLLPASTDR